MEVGQELLKSIRTFIKSAKLLYEKADYTSSCVLYFKALFSIFDYLLLTSGKGIPKDHFERLRKLEKYSKILYSTLDKLYPTYRITHTISISKDTCDEVRRNVEGLIREFKIEV